MSISLSDAQHLLHKYTSSESLLRHARCVQLVMEALARHFDENEEKWGITGLLHDADYERYPDEHPRKIVAILEEMQEHEIAHAIAGHYTKWGVDRTTLMDKAIVAADELTGFIYAAALIRPTKIDGMKVKSVTKKLKTKTFAASVDREEVHKGAELLGWELNVLITFIVHVLQEYKEELDLA